MHDCPKQSIRAHAKKCDRVRKERVGKPSSSVSATVCPGCAEAIEHGCLFRSARECASPLAGPGVGSCATPKSGIRQP
eukprot:4835748-Pleurochrysis_carterae.AAC.1